LQGQSSAARLRLRHCCCGSLHSCCLLDRLIACLLAV
jgi:hypothetical protein